MKTRNWLAMASGALALAAFSIVGNAYTAPDAHAQPLAQARPVTSTAQTTFNICLYEAVNKCIRSHGGGNQITIESSNYAVFHVVRVNAPGEWQMGDAGGKCLRAYADYSVGFALAGCDSTNNAEWWFPSRNGDRFTYSNIKYPDTYMGTFGTNSGTGVWIGTQQSGFYVGWINCC